MPAASNAEAGVEDAPLEGLPPSTAASHMSAKNGVQLLHAAASGDIASTRRLLRISTPATSAALFLAIQNNHSVVVGLLVGAGSSTLANTPLANGCLPLYTAVANGFPRVAKALVDAGARPGGSVGLEWLLDGKE